MNEKVKNILLVGIPFIWKHIIKPLLYGKERK